MCAIMIKLQELTAGIEPNDSEREKFATIYERMTNTITYDHECVRKTDKLKAKREKVAKAKEEIPREVELVCLKNRYGKSRYKAKFTYYPQFDYFVCSIIKSIILSQ